MIKYYLEDPEFDAYTRFDTQTGRLTPVSQAEFNRHLPPNGQPDPDQPVQRFEGPGAAVFVGKTSPLHTRFPRRLYFQITRNCNLECPACFIRAGSGGAHAPSEAIYEIASYMGQNGLIEVRLTGGEPTTHPDFLEIMHRFKQEGVYVSVASNLVIAPKILDALCEEPDLWLICSLDGNRQTHNRYRPNTFDLILKNLLYLKNKNPGLRLRLTTVLTKENQNQIDELGQICKRVDAESITIIPLRPQVRDPQIKEEMVTAAEFKQVLDRLVAAQEKYGIHFTTTIETDYKNKIYSDPVFRKRSSCAAGREGTNLDYDAARNEFIVYGCSYSPASDLLEDPNIRGPFLAGAFAPGNVAAFMDIWWNEDAWTLYRDLSLKPESCRSCEYLRRHQCTGSCPIQNIDYSALDASAEVLEQLKKRIAQTGEWYCYQNIDRD